MKKFCATCFILLCIATTLSAQPLAQRVPEDAAVYIGWCGGDSMPSAYATSHLKAVLDSSNLPAVFSDMIPRLVTRAAAQDKEAGQALSLMQGLLAPLWKHPTAIWFAGVDFDAKPPMPKVGLICQTGADTAAFVEQLKQIQALAHEPLPVTWTNDEQSVTLSIGAPPAPGGKSLADSDAFKQALAKMPAQPAMVAFIDFPRMLALVDHAIADSHDEKATTYWPRVREATGFSGLGRMICTSGFDSKDWIGECLVRAPEPRKGLVAWAANAPPLPEALLKCIPASSTYVGAAAFDLAGLVETIRKGVTEVEPSASGLVDRGFAFAALALRMNVERDLIQPLGKHWAVYLDPETAGYGIGGLVVVNQLTDPAAAERGLTTLGGVIANLSGMAMKANHLFVPSYEVKVGDVNVHYLGIPLISPSWAIQDGTLYAGLYPQVVASAAKFKSSGKPSILDNPDFQSLRQRLNAKNPTSLTFVDLRKTAPQGYQMLLAITRLGMGFADMWGVKAPELVLPTLSDLMPNLGVAGSVSWTDELGFHVRHVSPFPMSELLCGGGAGGGGAVATLATTALPVSVLLPSLNRTRETANRVKCAVNLRQIGQAMLLWSNEHHGKFPDTIADLLDEEITLDTFVCPSTSDSVPAQLAAEDIAVKKQWVAAHTDYIYLGKGKTSSIGAMEVVVYEKPQDHKGNGINVLFGDGHVEFLPMSEARKTIPGL